MRDGDLNKILKKAHEQHVSVDADTRAAIEARLLSEYRASHPHHGRWLNLLNLKNPVGRVTVTTLALLIILAGACEVPTSYDLEVGKQVRIELPADRVASMPSPADLMAALRQLRGVEEVSVNVRSQEGGLARIDAIVWGRDLDGQGLADVLRPSLDGANFAVSSLASTVHEKVRQRLGRALLNIEVSAETADEVRAEVLQQLTEQGFSGSADVRVETGGGVRTITIEANSDGGSTTK